MVYGKVIEIYRFDFQTSLVSLSPIYLILLLEEVGNALCGLITVVTRVVTVLGRRMSTYSRRVNQAYNHFPAVRSTWHGIMQCSDVKEMQKHTNISAALSSIS